MNRKKWPCEPKFTKGDHIYYYHRNGDTYPGIVLRVKNQMVKICCDGLQGDVTAYVREQSLTIQRP